MLQAALVAAASLALLWRERTRLREALEREERLRQALVHDLKNPMTSIMGCLTCVVHDSADQATQRRLLELALHSCRSQLELLDTITDVGRLEAGDLKPDRRSFDVGRLAREAVTAARGTAASLGIRIAAQVPEDMPTGQADPELLGRALAHLLNNAVRYTARGGEVRLEARLDGTELAFRVCDAGPRPASAEGLFDRYARVRQPVPARRSQGMNLYFCRLVAEAHGGSLALVPSGVGAVVELRLPAGAARAETVPSL